MALNIDDIIKLVEDEQIKFAGKTLNDKQITEFIIKLQNWIGQMDFTLPTGTTIVAYSGEANNGSYAWEVQEKYQPLQVIMLFILEIHLLGNYLTIKNSLIY